MSSAQKPTAIEKRAQNLEALAPFALVALKQKLPLVFPRARDLSPSPKPRYRSAYCYLGCDNLNAETLETFSRFEIAVRLFDYSHLEPLLAASIYVASAKGQVPFHPVSMFLLSVYRRERDLSHPELLRILRHPADGHTLRRCTGIEDEFPTESGLRYFEKLLRPALQQEINALQLDVLYQAGLLPVKPGVEEKASLSFDGMLHEARSHMRRSSVQASCYEHAPRPCPAQAKGKQGCDCRDEQCAAMCRHATPRDPQARFIVYTGDHQRTSPNTPVQSQERRARLSRMVYGYYSYASQLLDDELATYWTLPAAFGSATCGDDTLLPPTLTYLQTRFPWLKIGEVLADAGACESQSSCCTLLKTSLAPLRTAVLFSRSTSANSQTRSRGLSLGTASSTRSSPLPCGRRTACRS